MTNTFSNGAALPVTISQIQRLAETLQKRMHFDTAAKRQAREVSRVAVAVTPEPKVYSNRRGAGTLLASQLSLLTGRADVTIIGIPQGGMIVASEVSRVLRAPLVPWVVKKIQARLIFSATLGAVAEDGELLIDEEAFQRLKIPPTYLIDEVRACRAEVKRRAALYRDTTSPMRLEGRTLVIVDDGMASGFTVRAALCGLRRQRPARIIVAVPAAPIALARQFQTEVDEVITLETSERIPDMAQRFVHFPKVESDEIVQLLHQHRSAPATLAAPAPDDRIGVFAH